MVRFARSATTSIWACGGPWAPAAGEKPNHWINEPSSAAWVSSSSGKHEMRHPFNLRRRGWSKPAAMVALLIVAVSAAVWLWTRPAAQPGVDAGRAVAESFLAQLRADDAAAAWEATTAEFKSA